MNNIRDYLNKLKKFSFAEDSRKRTLLKSYELTKLNYNYGAIINAVDELFEVYCYVIDDEEKIVVSSLLLREFNKYDMALSYYKELGNMMLENDIDFLYDKCKSNYNL